MNKNDQKYLLNSEILVIVQHMMIKRRGELDSEEISDIEMDEDVCSDDNIISSDEQLFETLEAESPPLVASDLCSTDVNTDELLSDGSDSEGISPRNLPASTTPKKSESFFRFLVKRARKWKKRKEGGVNKNQGSSAKLSTVCDIDATNSSTSLQHSNSSAINSAAVAQTHPILDVRNLTKASQADTLSAEDNSTIAQCSTRKNSKSFSGCLKPPGLMIPRMGYFGLSEGNIPEALMRSDSEESVNRILSEESLLGEYLRDISQPTVTQKDRLQIPNAAINKLVKSMESLSIRCKSVESLSRAIYKSLIDLRKNGEVDHFKPTDDRERTSLFIEEETDLDLYTSQAPLATPETTPNFCRARSCEPFSVDSASSSVKSAPISSLTMV